METQTKVNTEVKPCVYKPKEPGIITSSCGIGLLPRNRYFIKDGKEESEPDKPINLRDYLKVNQASCDLGNIIARLQAGDESVINVKQGGISGDVVGIPNSVNAVSDIHKQMLRTFNSLNPEVKKLFKNEEDFYSACLDGSLASRIQNGAVKPIVEEKPEVKSEIKPEVKPEESDL